MVLSWIGTAVYLYGKAAVGSHRISVDSVEISANPNVQGDGLLGSKTGLNYGSYIVAFQHAEVTTGLGCSESQAKNRTILVVDDNTNSPNTFFDHHAFGGAQSWRVEPPFSMRFPDGSTTTFPRQMLTSTTGETVSCTLNKTNTSFLWGAVNFDHKSKKVILTATSIRAQTILIDDYSCALDLRQILYWESGPDRNETYTVEITQINAASSFSFSRLKVIDGAVAPISPNTNVIGVLPPCPVGSDSGLLALAETSELPMDISIFLETPPSVSHLAVITLQCMLRQSTPNTPASSGFYIPQHADVGTSGTDSPPEYERHLPPGTAEPIRQAVPSQTGIREKVRPTMQDRQPVVAASNRQRRSVGEKHRNT
uniref:Uncharacterized protein n=1 Tax=Moniliophthora roreri TaxID=221103 RepID=A0A0W0F4V7_MONRR